VHETMNMEKNIRLSCLLSYYGGFLTEKQRELMRQHYDEDLSLGEIAQREGITRQGVHDAIRRGEVVMENYESRLRLFERYWKVKNGLDGLMEYLGDKPSLEASEMKELKAKLQEATEIWENDDGL
jgi:uncharacterized protein